MSGFILSTFPIEFTLRVKVAESKRTRGIISLGKSGLITRWEVTKAKFSYLCTYGTMQVLHKRPKETVNVLYIFVSGMLL